MQLIRGLEIELRQVYEKMGYQFTVSQVSIQNSSIKEVLNNFTPIFEEKAGCILNLKVYLHLRNGAKSILTRERVVPYALRERVEEITPLLSTPLL